MNLLEKKFASTFKSKYAISFVNGTATMHAALEAMGIKNGDEVIVPPLTMSSTAFAVLQANATPIFADIDADTFLIDPNSIKKKISNKTKAIITVALYGLSPDMDKIKKISKKIKIIEDNAECFLGYYKNKIVGTKGDCASFSFQSSKHITSGEGGMIITSDKNLADKIRKVQSLGYMGLKSGKSKIDKKKLLNPNYNRHYCLGWNYRMPELCSAVALGQLENIEYLVNQRRKVAKIFLGKVKKYNQWFVPQKVPKNCKHSYWTFAVKLETDKISWKEFVNKFTELGGDIVYAAWKLSYEEPVFRKTRFLGRDKFIKKKHLRNYKKKDICPIAERLQPKILQFKTNYWKLSDANKQADVLEKTLNYLEKKLR